VGKLRADMRAIPIYEADATAFSRQRYQQAPCFQYPGCRPGVKKTDGNRCGRFLQPGLSAAKSGDALPPRTHLPGFAALNPGSMTTPVITA
jgi:hypothetical protein